MKSFLLSNKTNSPALKWGLIPENTHFIGNIPDGYSLALSPSENIVILDVDNKNGKCGFLHIPQNILDELMLTFHYYTKSLGAHYFIRYMGNKILKNTSTQWGLDLRIGAKGSNSGGYVKYYGTISVQEIEPLIKESSKDLDLFLEKLFS